MPNPYAHCSKDLGVDNIKCIPPIIFVPMIHRQLIAVCLLILAAPGAFAQSDNGYIPPMDIPLILAGNFGELRRNHFHTGIDIKTQGRQGIPLLSIADGYVSRIKVSPYGYGNALYIDHPDGRTSVYAHMRAFNDTIAAFIRAKQYELETWAIEFYPEAGELPLIQGDVIGLSGNSGSSSGPHLHFEIRETDSEHPLNPLSFGFKVTDSKPPVIRGMRAYPLNEQSHVEQSDAPKGSVAISNGSEGSYRLDNPIHVNGSIGLGIHTYDLMSGTSNKYGIYKLEMYVEDELHYSHTMDELDFDNFRQVNCHKDYDLFHNSKWRYHKCFPSENNTLEIYGELIDDGTLRLSEGDTLDVKFVSSDIEGNSSLLLVTLIGSSPVSEPWPVSAGIPMDASSDNLHLDSGLVVRIPKGRIYEDFNLRPSRQMSTTSTSDVFTLHDKDVPLNDIIKVSIKAHAADSLSRIVMECTDFRGRKNYLPTVEYNDWFEAENKYFGTYRLINDITPPFVTVSGLSEKAKKNSIKLSLRDDGSGVSEFKVRIDGQYLLMSHNTSMSRAWGKLADLNLAKGEHVLEVVVKDIAGNVKTKSIDFQY